MKHSDATRNFWLSTASVASIFAISFCSFLNILCTLGTCSTIWRFFTRNRRR